MTASEDPNGLREALADILMRELIVRRDYDSVGRAADWIDGREAAVDRILSGLLASLIATRDAQHRTSLRAAEAELDEERQESARLALAVTEGQAEIARLKEAVVGLLPRKLCGEIPTTPNEERVQITVTFGAIRLGRQALATLSPKEHPHD